MRAVTAAWMSGPVTREWLERVFEQVKNWGRWGPDDELGALNYVTPERRAAAARLVREGVLVGCALDLAVEPAADNPTPAQHMMVVAGDARESVVMGGLEMSLDFFGVACHGSAVSHIDTASAATASKPVITTANRRARWPAGFAAALATPSRASFITASRKRNSAP